MLASEALVLRASTQVERFIEMVKTAPEQMRVTWPTRHTLHAGIYSRTITVPAGVAFASALIKIPTTVIINGHCVVWVDDTHLIEIEGHRVIAARAPRRFVYLTYRETSITMSFRTDARSVEEAEAEFTDEADQLMSRNELNEMEG